MAYPTAPLSLKLSWENALSFESAAVSQNFYGGVDERGNRNQLNQTTQTQALTLVVPNYSDYLEINTFLTANIGRPVYFNSTLYIYDSFKWSQQNGRTFNLDLNLMQVFRP